MISQHLVIRRIRRPQLRRAHLARLVCFTLLVGILLGGTGRADTLRLFPTRQTLPELQAQGEWLNTAGTINLKDLRGKFVVLDFWTYCCINCIHILPELKKLEQAYPNNVVVIGIHSAKFATERDPENVREAILRHNIEHPVFVDPTMAVWRKWNISMWPTIILVDPEGHWIAKHEGEIKFEAFDEVLKRAIPNFRRQGLLDETPLRFALERDREPPTPLRFPGKVLADAASNRLFIADSAHHRLVVSDLEGTLIDVIGTGSLGRQDGAFDEATFSHPQGMALHEGILYVADTENHLIRQVDLKARQVSTIAGTGQQARRPLARAVARATGTQLASPWALLVDRNQLYIAMAGTHQIWRMRLPNGGIDVHAGSGVEDILDGPLAPRISYEPGISAFAQPSGLASDGEWLYVADSEGSSIRAVPFDPRSTVTTVLGTSKQSEARLFTYGDRDGPVGSALLQHAVCVAHQDGRLFIADTYNNKVKELDLARKTIATIAGQSGQGDSPSQFNEPMGLSVAGNQLYVADTNNHLIRVIELKDSYRVRTLTIDGLNPPAPRPASGPRIPPADASRTFEPTEVKPTDSSIDMVLNLELPAGYKLNANAPFGYFVQLANDERLFDPAVTGKRHAVENPEDRIRIELPLIAESGKERIRVTLTYFYCREGSEGICKVGTVNWTGQIVVSPDASLDQLVLEHIVEGN